MEALESDSSTSQGEHSSSGSPSEEDVNTRGHHFGRTTINSGQAHLGDSFYVTNNIYPSPAVTSGGYDDVSHRTRGEQICDVEFIIVGIVKDQ